MKNDSSSTTTVSNFRESSRTNLFIALAAGLAIIAAGYWIVTSRALGPFAAVEPESGTLSLAVVGSDQAASGGKYLQFGSNVPEPPTPPVGSSGFITDYYKKWSNGPNPNGDPSWFPIGVWMQDPGRQYNGKANAVNYKNLGIAYDVGLWEDEWWSIRYNDVISNNWMAFPSVNRISTIKANTSAAKNFPAYLLEDEADMNILNDPVQFGVANQTKLANEARAADPTRPIYANYGKAMSIYKWVAYARPATYDQDMKGYCDAVDLVSADYYGNLDAWEPDNYKGPWTYGKVTDNLKRYCGDKPVWGFVETSAAASEHGKKPTPDQMEQATWNMIMHGATGIIYFAHQFFGGLVEDAMLKDPAMSSRAAQVNTRIKSLAPVLNSYSKTGVTITSTNSIPVTHMYKVYNNSRYVLTQADGTSTRNNSGATTATINVSATGVSSGTATVVDENRTVPITNGVITDNYNPYQVHIYKF